MVKFRPSLEPPAHRHVQVQVNTRRPFVCLGISVAVGALMCAAFIASGWNFYEHRFKKGSYTFYTNDEISMWKVANDFSSVFCSAFEVNLHSRGEVYLLPSKAKVNKSLSGREETISLEQVYGQPYNVRHYYLIDQSEISLSACRENGSRQARAEILLIKGDKNLDTWRVNKRCSGCVASSVTIPGNAYCGQQNNSRTHTLQVNSEKPQSIPERDVSNGPARNRTNSGQRRHHDRNGTEPGRDQRPRGTTLDYIVSSDDKYYILILYGRPRRSSDDANVWVSDGEVGIKVTGSVRRTSFKTDKALKTCLVDIDSPGGGNGGGGRDGGGAGGSGGRGGRGNLTLNGCTFDLPYNSQRDIVVRFDGARRSDPNRDRQYMDTTCHIRLSIWICLFGLLPLGIIAVFSMAMAFFFCRQRKVVPKAGSIQARKRRRTKSRGESKDRQGYGTRDSIVIISNEIIPEAEPYI